MNIRQHQSVRWGAAVTAAAASVQYHLPTASCVPERHRRHQFLFVTESLLLIERSVRRL